MQKLLLFVFLSLASAASGQNPTMQKSLDSLLTKHFKTNEPGMAVFIARKGQVIYQEAIGSANLELDVPLQTDMVFKTGSITKPFTAIGILQLVEQGKISLQDSVQKFIPDFPFKGHTITVEHLLTHTSGIRDFQTIDHPDPYILRHDFTPTYIIDHFKNVALEFEPGTKYNYTNSGYTLLGYIIEKVSGKSYQQYMKENVLDKAGMKNSGYFNESNIIPKRVTGYNRDKGFYENAWYCDISVGYGCGDLLSTLPDLYNWATAVWTNRLLKKETMQKATAPYRLAGGKPTNYGYGWILDSLYGRKCTWHGGQVSGFICFQLYFPDEDVFTALFTNVQSGEDNTEFSYNRFKLFFDIPFYAFDNKVPGEITLKDEILDRYVGQYAKDQTTIKIFREKGRLYLQFDAPYLLHPVSATRFIASGVKTPVTIEFIRDAAGKTTGMVVWQNGIYEWTKTE